MPLARACGPDLFPDDIRFFLFNPAVANYPQMMAFQYCNASLHEYDPDALWSDRKLNCEEWIRFAQRKVKLEDVDDIQYNTSPDSFLMAHQSGNWTSFGSNSFIKWLKKNKNKNALNYFVLAKAIEKVQTTERDEWGDPGDLPSLAKMDSLALVAERLLNANPLSFLKERLAFQLVKCRYYQGYYSGNKSSYTEALQVFDNYLANSNSITAQWALIYYADMQSDKVKRALYFMKAFDQSEEKKVRAFGYLDKEVLDDLANRGLDQKNTILLKVLQSLRNPGHNLAHIQYVFEHDPQNKYLNVMITREISKLEDWVLTTDMLRFIPYAQSELIYKRWEKDRAGSPQQYADENYVNDKKYLKEVLDFLLAIRDKGYKDEAFLQLAIIHLYNVNGSYDNALAMIKLQKRDDQRLSAQLLIDEMMAVSNVQDISQEDVKSLLATQLQRLKKLGYAFRNTSSEDYGYSYYANYESSPGPLMVYLARKFEEKNEFVTAGLLVQKSGMLRNEYVYRTEDSNSYAPLSYLDKYGTPEDVDRLVALKHRNDRTAFEKIIVPDVWGSDNMYLDLKGSMLLRQQKFEEALQVFNQLPENFWETTYYFKDYLPLRSITNVTTLIPYTAGEQKRHALTSKQILTQEIVTLKNRIDQAANREEAARYTFYMANALVNMSYYGDFWMLSVYGNSSTEPYNERGISNYKWVYHYVYPSATNHVENYYGLNSAMALYQRSLQLSVKDKEQAAMCTLMLGFCEEVVHSYNFILQHPDDYWSPLPEFHSDYIQQLKDKYAHTMVFENALSECSDVRVYPFR